MEFGFTRILLDAFGRRLLERPINIKRKTYRRAHHLRFCAACWRLLVGDCDLFQAYAPLLSMSLSWCI